MRVIKVKNDPRSWSKSFGMEMYEVVRLKKRPFGQSDMRSPDGRDDAEIILIFKTRYLYTDLTHRRKERNTI